MVTLAIRIKDDDLALLKKRAEELRIPFTVLARSLIITALKEKENTRP